MADAVDSVAYKNVWHKRAKAVLAENARSVVDPAADEQWPAPPPRDAAGQVDVNEVRRLLDGYPTDVQVLAGAKSYSLNLRDVIRSRLASGTDKRIMLTRDGQDGGAMSTSDVLLEAYATIGAVPTARPTLNAMSLMLVYRGGKWVPLVTEMPKWAFRARHEARRMIEQDEVQLMMVEQDDVERAQDEQDDAERAQDEAPEGENDVQIVEAPPRCVVCLETDPVHSDNGELFIMPCKVAYHAVCLANLIKNTDGNRGTMCCHADKRDNHYLYLSPEAAHALRLQGGGLLAKITQAARVRNSEALYMSCPLCKEKSWIANHAKVFVCNHPGCVSPEFGYCIKCRTPLKEDVKHKCGMTEDEAEKVFRELAGRHGDAIMPCPKCNFAAEIVNNWACKHITCCCGTRYCGACRYVFPLDARGTANYVHRCVVTSNENAAIPRNHIEKFYKNIGGERVSSAGAGTSGS